VGGTALSYLIDHRLSEALYIEKLELSKQLLNKLQRLASFLNPEFYKLQNLRRSTFNTPRVISLFDMNERYIIVPRGLTSKIKQLFKSHNATLIIEDKRFTKKIDKQNLTITFSPTGELRENAKKVLQK